MFCVLSVTCLLCVLFSVHAVWIILAAIVLMFLFCILLPIKFDDWFAKKINPCILEYQQTHDFEKLADSLNHWLSWAFTKSSRNAIQLNLFCALLGQKRFEESKKQLEQIRLKAKTKVDWMNYHLLAASYAHETGNIELEKCEQRLSEELKAQLAKKNQNTNEPATARQCRNAFLAWLSFSLFLLIGGSVSLYLTRNSISAGVGAIILSWFAFPVAVVWLILWLIRRRREHRSE